MKENERNNHWPLVGNERIADFLEKVLAGKQATGTYIFAGPNGLGKTTTALYFAQSLFCQKRRGKEAPCGLCPSCRQFKNGSQVLPVESLLAHSDLHFIKCEEGKKNISITQVREFIGALGLSSFLNSYQIGIIKDAEHLSIEAGNALLKTLEEPKAKVVIILIANQPELLPQTIVSRSQILQFHLAPSNLIFDHLLEKYKLPRSLAKRIARFSAGRPALASKYAEDQVLFKARLAETEKFFSLFSEDFLARMKTAEDALKDNEGAVGALGVINSWEAGMRDLYLSYFNHPDLAWTEAGEKSGLAIKDFAPAKIITLAEEFKKARKYLNANVSPKAVLEQLIINL